MKRRLLELWENLTSPRPKALPAGVNSMAGEIDGKPFKLHLRLEPNGAGLLILNASTILHLNQTGAELAYYFVQQKSPEEITAAMVKRYRVDSQIASDDLADFMARLQTLITTPDLDPEIYLDSERTDRFAGDLAAPIRLDCALTYKTNEPAEGETPQERVKRELLTEEWSAIFDKAWAAGIPHLVLTGGEPTLRPDLPELIAHTQQNGQVCSLLTDGLRLTDSTYLHQLLDSGLDHIMLLLDIADKQSWEAMQDILNEDIALTVHITVTPTNFDKVSDALTKLREKGVKAVSLSTTNPALREELLAARHVAASLQLPVVWDLPVPYSAYNPAAMESDIDIPQGAGKAWLYVEPDGDVLRGQGMPEVMGNLVTNAWQDIWKKCQSA